MCDNMVSVTEYKCTNCGLNFMMMEDVFIMMMN